MLLPQLHPLLLLLLTPAGAAETLSADGFSLPLPAGFSVAEDEALLVGQWSGGHHPPSGGGWAIRSLPADRYTSVRARVAGRVDVDAALSADRFAMLALQAVQGTEGLRTVYVGPADGVDPQVGRWVYTAPGGGGERLAWWHVYWRTPDHFVELAAWAPLAQFPRLQTDLRAVEGAGRPRTDPVQTLLFESGQQGCGPPLNADRSAAIRDSRRFDDAREVLRDQHAQDPDPTALRLAEHRALGLLYRHAEACVHEVARAQRVCSVREGDVRGERSAGLQEAVVACLDGEAALGETLAREVEAVWSAP